MIELQHKRRIRRGARGLSWVLVPLVMIALCAWFFLNLVVCVAGGASPFELQICNYGHVLPDIVGALALVNLAWLAYVLIAFSEEASGIRREPGQSRAKYFAARGIHGYRSLDFEHRDIVYFALELSAWASVFVLGVLVFYWTEYAFPLGLLVIAAIVRIAFGMFRWIRNRLKGTGSPPAPKPTTH